MTVDTKAADDRELLRAFVREGSDRAFGDVVGRHGAAVYSAAMRRVNGERGLAEDVVEQVFAGLARRARGLAEGVVLGGWLHRQTGVVALQAMDRERRRPGNTETEAPSALHLTDPLWHQVAPVLDEAMDRLPQADRDVLVLRFFEQYDDRATAAALDVAESEVAPRVERALEKLCGELGRRRVAATSVALSAVLAAEAVRAAPPSFAGSVAGTALAMAAAGGGGGTWWDLVPRSTRRNLAVAGALVAGVMVWQQMRIARWQSVAVRAAAATPAPGTSAVAGVPGPPGPPRARVVAPPRPVELAHAEVMAEAARIVRAGAPDVHSATQALHGLLDGVRTNEHRAQLLQSTEMVDDESVRRPIRRAIIEQWVQHDPAAAAAFIESTDLGNERAWLMDALGRAWVSSDPPRAAEWWMAHAPGPQTLIKIMDVWAQADPDSAGDWLGRQPAGPESDAARMAFARQVADIDPESALQWAETIADASMRETTVDHVFTEWRLRDATAAHSFAQESAWPDERRQRLLATDPLPTE